jgi:DNA-binding IclR family transcriptional regulator
MDAKLRSSRVPSQDPSPPTRRVVTVIELLAKAPATPLTLTEICRELGITRSTGHAIVATLCSYNWVLRDPLSGTYTLGSGFPRPQSVDVPILGKLRGPLRQLCATLGMPVCVSEVNAGHITVIASAAPDAGRAYVQAGQRLPFVAPFGREFVAWASAAAQQEWLDAAGPVNDIYRARMPEVLNEIQHRGYGIERLSDSLIKVYAALLALEAGNVPDPVAVRLAAAVADLTIVDFLPGELAQIEQSALATISAPIFDHHGEVVMTVSAQPYKQLTLEQVRSIGGHIRGFAGHASSLIAGEIPATGSHRPEHSAGR